ncbi:MAG: hypothetical protein HQ567_16680 [Candidatus Nealsonbacteria bacterium]|nr:hypothetical protein [Candidatus Nealsonbacteria bacterium]
MLLVGEGNVGKSSLVAALQGKPFVENRPTTHGIELGNLYVPHPDGDKEIRLTTWDFGGQEVYRITHQFFFSRGSFYMLVWQPREGTQENAVEEWLQRIRLRVSQEEARVVLVATHADERRAELDISALRDQFGEMVRGFYRVDSKTGRGIRELKNAIAGETAALPHLRPAGDEHWKWSNLWNWLDPFSLRKLGYKKYELWLWCDHPDCPHPATKYEIPCSRKWLRTVAPITLTVAVVLAKALPMIEPAIRPYVPPDLLKTLKPRLDRMKELAEMTIDAPLEPRTPTTPECSGLTEAQGLALRELHDLLLDVDPRRNWGGLTRHLDTASGDYHWVCPRHRSLFDPGLPVEA